MARPDEQNREAALGHADKRPATPARAPRGTLSRAKVLGCATKILDEEGLEAVTIRRLARQLGVRPMALYTYFRSKEEILAAVYDSLFDEIDLPADAGLGFDGVREVVRAHFHLLTQHVALVRMVTGSELTGSGELRMFEAIYQLLLAAGLDRRDAVGLVASLRRFTLGCAVLHETRRGWDEDREHWPRVRDSLKTLPPDRYPVLQSFGEDLPEFTQEQVFEFGLEALLARFAVRN